MAINKLHDEFHTLDMQRDWRLPEGYDPASGAQELILSGALDTERKRGSRTRLLRLPAGLHTKKPFVHDYWEEVFLVEGDLTVGNDEHGNGGTPFKATRTQCVRPAHGTARSSRTAAACCWRSTTTTRRKPGRSTTRRAAAQRVRCPPRGAFDENHHVRDRRSRRPHRARDRDRHARDRVLDRPRHGRHGEAHPRTGGTRRQAPGDDARVLPRRGRSLGPSPAIQVSGGQSSGEAEFVLLRDGGETFVGIASDHTDREVETYGITVSKQMCGKPCANTLWKFDDVAGHWDQLVLRAYATIDGERVLYQEGKVTAMRAPDDLLAQFARHDGRFVDGTAMLCGTLAAIGGIRPAERFEVELEDPVLGRTLRHAYAVDALPVAG